MAVAIQLVSWLIWFPLKILGLNAVLRAGIRRYPLIFAYMTATVLFATVQMPMAIGFLRSDRTVGPMLRKINMWGQICTYSLIFAVVLSLVFRATEQMPGRRTLRLVVIAVSLAMIGISLLVRYDGRASLGVWMTPWTRDLKFFAAIVDLVLWGLLISAKKRDSRLLMLTGGMGIMFAGEAIGAAIQSIAIPHKSLNGFYGGHFLGVLASVLFQYVWWQVFRKEARANGSGGERGMREIKRAIPLTGRPF